MITLRNWNLSDVDTLAEIADNKKIADNLRNRFPHPYTRADAHEYISEMLDNEVEISRAIEWQNELVGCISLILEDDVSSKCAELGYWIGEKYWRRGIASAAIKSMCEIGFKNFELVRIYAVVLEHNHASAKVLEKCGFELEGRLRKAIFKHGKIFDALLYSLIAGE